MLSRTEAEFVFDVSTNCYSVFFIGELRHLFVSIASQTRHTDAVEHILHYVFQ